MTNPLNKVVFIQKVASFSEKSHSLKDLLQLAYVNNSWNDTIKNYCFHLFEQQLRDVGDVDTLEKICTKVIKCGVPWFVDVLACYETLKSVNLPMIVCKHAPRMDLMTLVFDKIFEVGGAELLTSQLAETDHRGSNCLLISSRHFSSPEVVNLIFEKIVEAGGKELLKSQLAATTAGGYDCLMLSCCNPNCPAVVRLVIEKILEAGGTELLKQTLIKTTSNGWDCLVLACDNSSQEILKLLAVLLFELGLFNQQFAKLGYQAKRTLRVKVNEIKDASWVPDPDSIAEVKKMLQRC